MQIRMIITRVPDELDIPDQESLYHATGRRVDVTGQTEKRKDIPVLDESGNPTGETENVHDGWEFFPETVDEYAGGYALEIGDKVTTMVWLDIPDADFPIYEAEGQDPNDTRLFIEVVKYDDEEEVVDEEIPGQLIAAYVAWVRANIPPGSERGKLISAYAQDVTRGQAKKAWREFYDNGF